MKVNKNRGFTLVELIIAFAILAVAGVAVTGFVNFSSKTFSKSNSQLKLQYEQQVVINSLRDAIIKTTRGINFDNSTDTLLVLSESGDEALPVLATQFRLNEGTHELKMAERKISVEGIAEDEELSITFDSNDEEPLSDSMIGFDVDLTEVNNNRVTLHVAFQVGDKEVEVHPVIALRNEGEDMSLQGDGLNESDYDEDYTGVTIDPVRQVVIYKDGQPQSFASPIAMKMTGSNSKNSIQETKMQLTAEVIKNKAFLGDIDEGVTWTIDGDSVKSGYNTYINIDNSTGILTVKPIYEKVKINIIKYEDHYNIPSKYINDDGYIVVIATSTADPTKSAKVRIKLEEGGVYPKSLQETHAGKNKKLVYDDKAEYLDTLYTGNTSTIIYKTEYSIEYSDGTKKTGQDALNNVKLVSVKTSSGQVPPEGAGFVSGKFDGKFYATHEMASKTYTVTVQSLENNQSGEVITYSYDIVVPAIEEYPDRSNDITIPKLTLLTTGELKRNQDIEFNIQWSRYTPTIYHTPGALKDAYVEVRPFYEIEINTMQNNCGNWERNERSRFTDTISLSNKDDTNQYLPTQQKQKIIISNDKLVSSNGGKYRYVDFIGVAHGNNPGENDMSTTFTLKAAPYLDWNARFTLQVTMRVRLAEGKVEKIGEKQHYYINGKPSYVENIYGDVYRYSEDYGYFKPGQNIFNYREIHTDKRDEAFVVTKELTFNPVTMTLEEVETNPLPESYAGIINNSNTIGLGKKTNEPATPGEMDIITDKPLTNKVLYDYYKVFKPTFTALYVTPDNYNSEVHLKLADKMPNGESPIIPYYYNKGERVWNKNVEGVRVGIYNTTSDLYFYGMMTPVKWYKKTATFPIGAKISTYISDNRGNGIYATYVQDGKRLDYKDYKVKFQYEK